MSRERRVYLNISVQFDLMNASVLQMFRRRLRKQHQEAPVVESDLHSIIEGTVACIPADQERVAAQQLARRNVTVYGIPLPVSIDISQKVVVDVADNKKALFLTPARCSENMLWVCVRTRKGRRPSLCTFHLKAASESWEQRMRRITSDG